MNNMLSEIEGGSITVREFLLESSGDTMNAKMQCAADNGKAYFFVFQNVSEINMSNVSYPFQIDGFEISDNSSRGYQKDCRFFVDDYEDGMLSFYCESFDVFDASCDE